MREILFKAKRKDNNEWVYGWLLKTKYDTKRIFIRTFPNKDDDYENYVVIPETICEYTGLTDKNGVKIFEGDIIENKIGGKGIVKFDEYGSFIVDFIDDVFCSNFCPRIIRDYVVTGNKFDEIVDNKKNE